ncbi:MAG: DUF839 domain-containing protein [Sulfuricurvum sp.]|nr:DUF839 domain-containing protein [Sulfuricurvum sp.]
MAGCNDDDSTTTTSAPAATALLGFSAVAENLNDTVMVPTGYTSEVVFATGDPIKMGVSAYANDGTNTGDFDDRSGDCHDGMVYFGLKSDNRGYSYLSTERYHLCYNC